MKLMISCGAVFALAVSTACGDVAEAIRPPGKTLPSTACSPLNGSDRGVTERRKSEIVACGITPLGKASIEVRRSSSQGVCFTQTVGRIGGYEECEGSGPKFAVAQGTSVTQPVAGTAGRGHLLFAGLTSSRVAWVAADVQPAAAATAVATAHGVVTPGLARKVGLRAPVGRYVVVVPRDTRAFDLAAFDSDGNELDRIHDPLRP